MRRGTTTPREAPGDETQRGSGWCHPAVPGVTPVSLAIVLVTWAIRCGCCPPVCPSLPAQHHPAPGSEPAESIPHPSAGSGNWGDESPGAAGSPWTRGCCKGHPHPQGWGAGAPPASPKPPGAAPGPSQTPDSAALPVAAVDILAAPGVAGGSGQLAVAWEPMALPGAQRRGVRCPGKGWGQRGSAELPGISTATAADSRCFPVTSEMRRRGPGAAGERIFLLWFGLKLEGFVHGKVSGAAAQGSATPGSWLFCWFFYFFRRATE